MKDFCDSDDEDITISYKKEVAQNSNLGYRDGLSAGRSEGFLEEFRSGFHSSLPFFIKLIQLSKLASRCLHYYKGVSISDEGKNKLSKLVKTTELVTNKTIKKFSGLPKNENGLILSERPPPDVVASNFLNHKLHEDDNAGLTWSNLLKDLTLIRDFLDECRSHSLLNDVGIDELVHLLDDIIATDV